MGLVGRLIKILQIARKQNRYGAKVTTIKGDPNGGANLISEVFTPAGNDSLPLPSDYAFIVPRPKSGQYVVLGYLDPNAPQAAAQGEQYQYARDADGNIVATMWQKQDGTVIIWNEKATWTMAADGAITSANESSTVAQAADGSITQSNGSGSIALGADGIVTINGATIDTTGKMTSPTGVVTPSAVIDGVEAAGHTHTQENDSAGNTEEDVGPMQ